MFVFALAITQQRMENWGARPIVEKEASLRCTVRFPRSSKFQEPACLEPIHYFSLLRSTKAVKAVKVVIQLTASGILVPSLIMYIRC